MHYYKGLFSGSLYNCGFLGGWRAGTISIDGHYRYITDLKQFVVWQFADYGSLTYVIDKHQEPKLSEVEVLYVNDEILDNIRRAMYNDQHPNLTDINANMWDDVYGHERGEMQVMWDKLKKHPFSKSNVGPNIVAGDTVKDTKKGEEFCVDYRNDIKYINQNDNYVLTKRYNYFPEIPIDDEVRVMLEKNGMNKHIKDSYWEYEKEPQPPIFVPESDARKITRFYTWRYRLQVKNTEKFQKAMDDLKLSLAK